MTTYVITSAYSGPEYSPLVEVGLLRGSDS